MFDEQLLIFVSILPPIVFSFDIIVLLFESSSILLSNDLFTFIFATVTALFILNNKSFSFSKIGDKYFRSRISFLKK